MVRAREARAARRARAASLKPPHRRADAGGVAYDVGQQPGAWVAERARRTGNRLLVGGVAYAAITCTLTWLALTHRLTVFDSVLILALALALRPHIEQSIDAHFRWELGAEAERSVGVLLEELRREGWVVMHDIERQGSGNLDHVLSGPGGVFLIETKARRYIQGDIGKTKWRAAKLSGELGVWITPVIALNERRSPKVFETQGVTVAPKQSLLPWLRAQRRPTIAFEKLARWADQL